MKCIHTVTQAKKRKSKSKFFLDVETDSFLRASSVMGDCLPASQPFLHPLPWLSTSGSFALLQGQAKFFSSSSLLSLPWSTAVPWPCLSLSRTAGHTQTFGLRAFPSLPSLPLAATPAQKILLHPPTPSSSIFSRKFPKLSSPGLPWCFISVSWSGGGSMLLENGKTGGSNKLDWLLVAVLGSGDVGGSQGGEGTLELCSCYTTETLPLAFPVLLAYYLWPLAHLVAHIAGEVPECWCWRYGEWNPHESAGCGSSKDQFTHPGKIPPQAQSSSAWDLETRLAGGWDAES